MLVRATQKGYYGEVLREEGHIFRLKDPKHFADANDEKLVNGWMEKVEEKVSGKPIKGGKSAPYGARPAAEPEEAVLSRIARAEQIAAESDAEDKSDVI